MNRNDIMLREGRDEISLSLADLSPSSPLQTPRRRVRRYNMGGDHTSSEGSERHSIRSFGSFRSPRRVASMQSSSPRRLLTPTLSARRQKALEPMLRTLSQRTLMNESIKLKKEDRIGRDKLESIEDHKSAIAEMRRSRQVRFEGAKKETTAPKRIERLGLADLDLAIAKQGLKAANRTDEEKLEDEIRRLENKIKKCFGDLDRVQKETDRDVDSTIKLRAENMKLRKEIRSLSTPQKKSLRLAQKQLDSTIRSLRKEIQATDEQIILIQGQRQLLEIEMEGMLGLSDHMALLDQEMPTLKRKEDIDAGRHSPKDAHKTSARPLHHSKSGGGRKMKLKRSRNPVPAAA